VAREIDAERDAALSRVIEYRERGRARPRGVRVALAVAALLLGVAALPLAVVLPEVGIPAVLVSLRLLAVEFDWAARSYAWLVWRWEQVRGWYRRQPQPMRALVIAVLIAIAAALVWLLVHEFSG